MYTINYFIENQDMAAAFSFLMLGRILRNEFPAAAQGEEIENVNLQAASLQIY